MKITIRYDNSITEFEVTEKECRDMIESDYRERLCGSEHPETITRRPIQVILDERFNKPEQNNYRKMTRHTFSLENQYDNELLLADEDADCISVLERKELCRRLSNAIRQLEPQQQALLYRVIFQSEKEADIARAEGVSKAAISHRLDRIFRQIEKKLKKF